MIFKRITFLILLSFIIINTSKSDFKEKLFYPNSLNKNIKKESTKKGDLIHELLSHIYYTEDIQKVVDEYFLKEKIDKKEKEYFRKIFKKIHLHPMIKEYFSKKS